MSDATPSDDAPKPAPPADGQNVDAAPSTPEQFPEDHPLVKALAAQKDEIKALKAKAARLDEIDEAAKSEAEKSADALAKAQAEAAQATAELLRYRAASAHGITDAEDIELFLTGSDEETLERQAKALAARMGPPSPRPPKPDPNQGRSGTSPETNGDRFASVVGPLIK